MSLFLVTVAAATAESWGDGESSGRAEVDEALGSVGAHMVRVWNQPDEVARPWHWLVVDNLANPVDTYDVLGRAGVEVADVAPLRLDPAASESHALLIDWLPQKLTPETAGALQEYLAPGIDATTLSVGPGIVVYPCCKGVGAHLSSCAYA